MARRKATGTASSTASDSAQPVAMDARAVQFLRSVYGKLPLPDPEHDGLMDTEEFKYARSVGVMFDPETFPHNDRVTRVVEACRRVTSQQVAHGFLSSLTTNRLEFRGALGCYAVFRHMPTHTFQPRDPPNEGKGRRWCIVCGNGNYSMKEDLNWVSYFRFKQGCAYDSPLEAALLLEMFAKYGAPEPTAEDRSILISVLDMAASLPETSHPGELEKKLSKLLKSNKYVRQSFLETLGYCGILQAEGCPGYLNEFARYEHRGYPPGKPTEWGFPLRWWRGSDGVNTEAVDYWFPGLR